MNLVELNNILKSTAESIPQVNSYYNSEVYSCWDQHEIKYGSVCVDFQRVINRNSSQEVIANIYYGDRLTESEDNKLNIYSDAVFVLTVIINKLKKLDGITINSDQIIELFTQKFSDLLAGGFISLSILITNEIGICVPIIK